MFHFFWFPEEDLGPPDLPWGLVSWALGLEEEHNYHCWEVAQKDYILMFSLISINSLANYVNFWFIISVEYLFARLSRGPQNVAPLYSYHVRSCGCRCWVAENSDEQIQRRSFDPIGKGCHRQRLLSIVNRKFVFTFLMCENATLALALAV